MARSEFCVVRPINATETPLRFTYWGGQPESRDGDGKVLSSCPRSWERKRTIAHLIKALAAAPD